MVVNLTKAVARAIAAIKRTGVPKIAISNVPESELIALFPNLKIKFDRKYHVILDSGDIDMRTSAMGCSDVEDARGAGIGYVVIVRPYGEEVE